MSDPRRQAIRDTLTGRYHGVIDVTEEMIDAVLAELPQQPAPSASRPAELPDFPGVPLGLLAYDISDLLGRAEYPVDFSQCDIEPNLPAFLRACRDGRAAIRVEIRNVYGDDKVYPADDTGRGFAKLTGKKTFSPADLTAIRALGYAIIVAASEMLPPGFGDPDAVTMPGGAVAWLEG